MQRAEKREREQRGDKWQPRWFKKLEGAGVLPGECPADKVPFYQYTGEAFNRDRRPVEKPGGWHGCVAWWTRPDGEASGQSVSMCMNACAEDGMHVPFATPAAVATRGAFVEHCLQCHTVACCARRDDVSLLLACRHVRLVCSVSTF
jgi:hypothetical protein